MSRRLLSVEGEVTGISRNGPGITLVTVDTFGVADIEYVCGPADVPLFGTRVRIIIDEVES